jgi:hypothetical protein
VEDELEDEREREEPVDVAGNWLASGPRSARRMDAEGVSEDEPECAMPVVEAMILEAK